MRSAEKVVDSEGRTGRSGDRLVDSESQICRQNVVVTLRAEQADHEHGLSCFGEKKERKRKRERKSERAREKERFPFLVVPQRVIGQG